MSDGSLVTISSVVLAIVSVPTLAAAAVRSWRDAERHRAEREAAGRIEARLRSQVRLLEIRVASLTEELDALRDARPSYAFGSASGPGRHPSAPVAARAAERFGDPGQGRGGLAAAANVILFPGPSERRARR